MKIFELIQSLLFEYDRSKTLQTFSRALMASGPFAAIKQLKPNVSDEDILNAILTRLENADPTPNKEFVPWLTKISAKQPPGTSALLPLELQQNLPHYLLTFVKYKLKKDFPQKDIMRLSAGDLINAVNNYVETDTKNQQAKQQANDATVVYDDQYVRVVTPKTEAAACKYGGNTKWCTAAKDHEDNAFDTYNASTTLYIFLPKQPSHPGEKYQMAGANTEFNDEQDNPANFYDVMQDRFQWDSTELKGRLTHLEPELEKLVDFSSSMIDEFKEEYAAQYKYVIDEILDDYIEEYPDNEEEIMQAYEFFSGKFNHLEVSPDVARIAQQISNELGSDDLTAVHNAYTDLLTNEFSNSELNHNLGANAFGRRVIRDLRRL